MIICRVSIEKLGLSNEMVVMADDYPIMLGFKGEKVGII